MVDLILKISRPVVFDFRCLNSNTANIVFMKKCHMDRSDMKVVTEFPYLLGHPACTGSKYLFLYNSSLYLHFTYSSVY